METCLALDLGGTKLLIGEVDRQGRILKYRRYDSDLSDQIRALELIFRSLDDYLSAFTPEPFPVAMGLSLVGRVDPGSGIWHQIDPQRTAPLALASDLAERYGIPCSIDNDVKSATRAELRWGAGQASRDFIYLNIGTGIAAGAVVDGHLVRGGHFNAGEVGHTQVGVGVGVRCCCGRMDCVEAIASGSGIDLCARLLRDRYRTGLQIPEDGTRVAFADVLALSCTGDPLCRVLVDNAATGIAGLIMNMVRMTDPDTVVLGGGIVVQDEMFERVLSHLHAPTLRFVTQGVVRTRLDARFAGLLGAAAVAFEGIQ